MALAHIEDVLYGSDDGGALDIHIPEELRREIGYERCLLVLIVYAYHANEDNLAWPSARTVSKSLGFDVRKVRAAIKVLNENRLLVRVANQQVRRRGITFYLNLPSCDPVESRYVEVAPNSRQKGVMRVPQESTCADTTLVTSSDTQACTKDKDKVDEKEKFDHLRVFQIPFDDFWSLYPNKSERGRAFIYWQTLALTPGLTLAAFFALKERLGSDNSTSSSDWPSAHSWLESKPWKSHDS